MKTVYTQPNCPGCVILKNKLIQQNVPFQTVEIGKDITKEEFFEKFPGVRSVPHVVD